MKLPLSILLVVLACITLNSVTIIRHKVITHNATPFGVVEEIVIPSKEKRMFDYFKEDCKALYPPHHYAFYMDCTHDRMKQYIKERDDANTD